LRSFVVDVLFVVEDLCTLLKALNGARPVLVGASMGGGTSLVAVGEDRVDATALVLVDIAPQIEPEGVQKIGAFMNYKPEGSDTLEEVAAAIAAYQPHRKPPKDLAGLAKNLRRAPDGKYRWHWDPRFMQMRRDMGRIVNTPTMMIVAEADDITMWDLEIEAFKEIPCEQKKLVILPSTSHMTLYSNLTALDLAATAAASWFADHLLELPSIEKSMREYVESR
jgi:pimeloyl-ACP methyl ester carboxylesterase